MVPDVDNVDSPLAKKVHWDERAGLPWLPASNRFKMETERYDSDHNQKISL